jgi:hypothetical protein
VRPQASQARTSPPGIESGSNVIPRRARPGLAGLKPHTGRGLFEGQGLLYCWGMECFISRGLS